MIDLVTDECVTLNRGRTLFAGVVRGRAS